MALLCRSVACFFGTGGTANLRASKLGCEFSEIATAAGLGSVTRDSFFFIVSFPVIYRVAHDGRTKGNCPFGRYCSRVCPLPTVEYVKLDF